MKQLLGSCFVVALAVALLVTTAFDLVNGYTSVRGYGRRAYRAGDPVTYWFQLIVQAIVGGTLIALGGMHLMRAIFG